VTGVQGGSVGVSKVLYKALLRTRKKILSVRLCLLWVVDTQFPDIQDNRKSRATKFDIYYQLGMIAVELNCWMNMLL
jgi:hypothetical protein